MPNVEHSRDTHFVWRHDKNLQFAFTVYTNKIGLIRFMGIST